MAEAMIPTQVDAESAAQPPLPPEQIAPHFPQLEILECLGRGGMGVVYKARQKTLNRFVALKLLAPERVGDTQFAERFTREAQALAALNHPNTVTIYDFGQAGGFYFLLMEFVDGVNLRQLLRARKFTPEEALAIVPPLCDALQFAHDRGIVHRDIKPENLLLDKMGRVKVADFGIAKILGTTKGSGTAGEPVASGNATQHALGTPAYSAPEQKTDPQRVDSRADIFSLGVVFYEMLTGELPGKQIEPPSHKVQIDVRLDEIVLRALEKNPELRYQQASVFKTQVETVAATRSEPDSRSESLVRIQKAMLRFVTFGLGFLLVCLLLLLGMSSEAIGARTWGCFRLCFEFLAAAGIVGFLFLFFRAIITRTPEAWHPVKFALPWVVFMALGISFGFVSPYLLRQPARTLTFRAFIDGSDVIKVSRHRLWMEHDSGSLPGKAIYVNGQAWTPTWTTNRAGSKVVSSEFAGLNPPFQSSGQGIQLTSKTGRGVVSIEQFPSDNDEALGVRVDDEYFGGADWYEFVISWDPPTKSIAAAAPQKDGAATEFQPAISAAEKWLAMVDARNYSGSWRESSAIVQGAATEQQFTNAMHTFRNPLGDLLSRKLVSSQRLAQMPGAPDGKYVVLQFETSFARKNSAIETVTFMLENGQWKPVSYLLK
jgi:tRNA A-37 threonylcarbamoyl transferase component Bud32